MSAGWLGIEFEISRDPETQWPTGVHYHRQKLVELSIVGVPANPDALRVAGLEREQETQAAQELVGALQTARLDMEESWNVPDRH